MTRSDKKNIFEKVRDGFKEFAESFHSGYEKRDRAIKEFERQEALDKYINLSCALKHHPNLQLNDESNQQKDLQYSEREAIRRLTCVPTQRFF